MRDIGTTTKASAPRSPQHAATGVDPHRRHASRIVATLRSLVSPRSFLSFSSAGEGQSRADRCAAEERRTKRGQDAGSANSSAIRATEDAAPRSSVAGAPKRARKCAALGCVTVAMGLLLVGAAQASDKYGFAFLEEFGSAAKPSFTSPNTLAVDPATGDLLVADAGENEVQKITFNNFADGDKFKLTWTPPGGSAATTEEIIYSANSTINERNIAPAIEAAFGSDTVSFSTNGQQGAVQITFWVVGAGPQSLISCAVVPGHGSGTCPVARTQEGIPSGLSRYGPNGEPDPFSALGTNVIEGREGADETPQGALGLLSEQIAVDGACAEHEPPLTGAECEAFDPADGDIYVTQYASKSVEVFSSSGEYLGQIDKATSNEVQQLELSGFEEGDELSLGNLPGACSESHTSQVPYDAVFGEGLQAALEAQCGPDFAVSTTIGVIVEFTGELGDTDVPRLTCTISDGPGTCIPGSTVIVPGDESHNEVQQLEFSGLGEGSKIQIGTDGSSGEPSLPQPPCNSNFVKATYSANLTRDLRTSLEARCGSNFVVSLSAGASANVTFSNSLGLVDRPQLACGVDAGSGSCVPSTVEDGGQAKPLGSAGGLAVDSAGAVYVADSTNDEIHKYLPSSNSPFEAETVAGFPVEGPADLAAGVGPTDGLLFYDRHRELIELDSSSGEQKYVVEPRGRSTLLSVNPGNGTLFSGRGELEVVEYDASGPSEAVRLAHFTPYEMAPNRSNIRGIAVDPAAGDLYESSKKNGEATGRVAVFEPVIRPEAVTEEATERTGESALLHGTVSANGGPPASCEFQYITVAAANADYEYKGLKRGFKDAPTAPCTPTGPFTGTGSEAVSAEVTGLAPGTPYIFRVVAENSGGATPESGDNGRSTEGALEFTTLGPAIDEQEVSEVTETEATISAQLNPNEEQTTYALEYVSEAEFQSSEYENATTYPLPQLTLEPGNEFVHVAITLSDLPPGSAWHARIAAANAVVRARPRPALRHLPGRHRPARRTRLREGQPLAKERRGGRAQRPRSREQLRKLPACPKRPPPAPAGRPRRRIDPLRGPAVRRRPRLAS